MARKNIIHINMDRWITPANYARLRGFDGETQKISMAIGRGRIEAWAPEGLGIVLIDIKSADKHFNISNQ